MCKCNDYRSCQSVQSLLCANEILIIAIVCLYKVNVNFGKVEIELPLAELN